MSFRSSIAKLHNDNVQTNNNHATTPEPITPSKRSKLPKLSPPSVETTCVVPSEKPTLNIVGPVSLRFQSSSSGSLRASDEAKGAVAPPVTRAKSLTAPSPSGGHNIPDDPNVAGSSNEVTVSSKKYSAIQADCQGKDIVAQNHQQLEHNNKERQVVGEDTCDETAEDQDPSLDNLEELDEEAQFKCLYEDISSILKHVTTEISECHLMPRCSTNNWTTTTVSTNAKLDALSAYSKEKLDLLSSNLSSLEKIVKQKYSSVLNKLKCSKPLTLGLDRKVAHLTERLSLSEKEFEEEMQNKNDVIKDGKKEVNRLNNRVKQLIEKEKVLKDQMKNIQKDLEGSRRREKDSQAAVNDYKERIANISTRENQLKKMMQLHAEKGSKRLIAENEKLKLELKAAHEASKVAENLAESLAEKLAENLTDNLADNLKSTDSNLENGEGDATLQKITELEETVQKLVGEKAQIEKDVREKLEELKGKEEKIKEREARILRQANLQQIRDQLHAMLTKKNRP